MLCVQSLRADAGSLLECGRFVRARHTLTDETGAPAGYLWSLPRPEGRVGLGGVAGFSRCALRFVSLEVLALFWRLVGECFGEEGVLKAEWEFVP